MDEAHAGGPAAELRSHAPAPAAAEGGAVSVDLRLRVLRAVERSCDAPSGSAHVAASTAHLRASVTAYVRSLRAAGVPPQGMLVLVKGVVDQATVGRLDGPSKRELVELVVRSSVDSYYHG